eukprot:1607806-Pleurochrysis_carterae.AAC.3
MMRPSCMRERHTLRALSPALNLHGAIDSSLAVSRSETRATDDANFHAHASFLASCLSIGWSQRCVTKTKESTHRSTKEAMQIKRSGFVRMCAASCMESGGRAVARADSYSGLRSQRRCK